MQWNYWSLRCSWSIACRRCSSYIFILDLICGLGKDNGKTTRETFKFWDFGATYTEGFTVYTPYTYQDNFQTDDKSVQWRPLTEMSPFFRGSDRGSCKFFLQCFAYQILCERILLCRRWFYQICLLYVTCVWRNCLHYMSLSEMTKIKIFSQYH